MEYSDEFKEKLALYEKDMTTLSLAADFWVKPQALIMERSKNGPVSPTEIVKDYIEADKLVRAYIKDLGI